MNDKVNEKLKLVLTDRCRNRLVPSCPCDEIDSYTGNRARATCRGMERSPEPTVEQAENGIYDLEKLNQY